MHVVSPYFVIHLALFTGDLAAQIEANLLSMVFSAILYHNSIKQDGVR
jgi:hypothetical protein